MDVAGNIYYTSSGVHEIINSSVGRVVADSFSVFENELCNGSQLTVSTQSYTIGKSVKTYFGDGTTDSSTILAGFGGGYAVINHNYALGGSYSLKQVLFNGGTKTDSLTFSYNYRFCRTLPVAVYYDENGDCIKESSEPYITMPTNTEVDSNSVSIATLSATSGFTYNAFGSPGDVYSFKIAGAPGDLHAICPSGGYIYDTIQSLVYNYPVQYLGLSCSSADTVFDLAEYISMRCGIHLARVEILINNTYCTPENAVVTMQIDPKYAYESAYPFPVSVSGHTIT